jgi:hypothetical protein
MGMLGKRLKTTIVNTAYHYNLERDQAKSIKTEVIQTFGIQRFWFICEYVNFYYFWNMVLLNEPPKPTTSTTITTSTST